MARPSRYPTTPEGFQALGGSLTAKQIQLLALMLRKTEKMLQREKEDLMQRPRYPKVIPVARQRAVDSAIGIRRSIMGLMLLLAPAMGILVGAHGHPYVGWIIGGLGLVGVGVLRALNQHQVQQLEIEPDELRALQKIAKSDPLTKQVLKQWQDESPHLAQQDCDRLTDYLATQALLKRWQQIARQVGQAQLLGPKPAWRR